MKADESFSSEHMIFKIAFFGDRPSLSTRERVRDMQLVGQRQFFDNPNPKRKF